MEVKNISLRKLFNVISVVGLILTVVLAAYGWRADIFTSANALDVFVHRAGVWGPVAFIILQIVQVVIPIIPGGVSLLAGVVIFGPLEGFLYNYIGIAIGSVIAFLLARKLGRTFLQGVSSTKLYDKYICWLDKEKRFDKLFAIAIFMPVAPDDFLCMLAGLTKMRLERFIAIILLCKPASIAAYSFGLSTLSAWLIKITTQL